MHLEDNFRRHCDLLCAWDDIYHSIDSVFPGADRFGILPEKFLQRLRIPAGYHTNRFGSLEVFPTFPEVLPKMGQMIDRVRIDSLLHCLSPLLVGNRNISNWPPDCPAESFDNFPHCWGFAHHR